ncbi:MAG TPA: hypothetical protein VFF16_00495 [Telluria sp.]|nr:hypothetical protein [Telluria sp.]
MRDIYLSELARFRNTALIALALHLLALLFLNQLSNPLQFGREASLLVLFLYLLPCAALALYQFGTYRQPGRWLWLLHRPLPPRRIFAAIAAASATLILAVLALPVLAMTALIDTLGTRVVDLRHYLLPLQLLLFCLCAWQCGACIALSRSRSAFVILVLPPLVLLYPASGFALLLPGVLCLLLLAWIAAAAFKPDRTAPSTRAGTQMLVALPLQISFYFVLLWAGSLAYQYAEILLGVHPLNREVPPAGGFTEASRATGAQLLQLGLSTATDPEAPVWIRQAALAEPVQLYPDLVRYPVRHALTNVNETTWNDGGIDWTFSHDSMRFEGRHHITGAPAGSFGSAGRGSTAPFETPPEIMPAHGHVLFATPHHLYRMDKDGSGWRELAAVAANEMFAGFPEQAGQRSYLLTNTRLLVFRGADDDRLEPAYSVALPRPLSDLARIDILPLLDGSVVSFLYGRAALEGIQGAQQIVMHVDAAGRSRTVARRALTHDFPPLFEHKDWWFSPLLHALVTLPRLAYDTGRVPDAAATVPNPLLLPRPRAAWLAALAGSLLAAAGAAWWLRACAAPPALRRYWLASCLLLGLPALCALAVLQPRTLFRPQAAAPPSAVPAA